MTNERQQEPLQEWQRQAWMTEYQVLQSDINATSSSYWTLAGIFIGISSALLIAAVFGIISNKDLYEVWLQQLQGQPTNIQPPQTIILIIGILIVFMLSFVRLWMRRATFLQQINFDRMREIESQLGTWKSWRVHGVDHLRNDGFDDSISEEDRTRLLNYQPLGWWRHWRTRWRYARPSGFCYDGIFAVLIFLWLFLAFSASSLLKFPLSFPDFFIIVIELLILGAADFLIIRLTRAH